MKTPDIVFGILILGCAIFGLWKGMCKTGFPILGAFFGAYMGICFYPSLLPYLQRYISHLFICKVLSFCVIFFVITLICSLIGRVLQKIFDILSIGWIDRVGGLFLGAVKGWIIVCAITAVICTFFAGGKIFQESALFPYIRSFLQKVSQFFPAEFLEKTLTKMGNI